MIIVMFILGLSVGSFINVCSYRIPIGESIAFPSSHCTSCSKRIKWHDLLPLLSYTLLKGKCRYCREKISLKYPVMEFIVGVLFISLYLKYGFGFNFVRYAFLAGLLIIIGLIDFKTTDVYFSTIITGLIAGTIFILYGYYTGEEVLTNIYGALLSGGVIAAIIIISGGMGWGDFEICLLSGLYFGLKLTFVMLFLSFLLGGISGIILIIAEKKSRKDYIPFGPYIAAASILTILFGEQIINTYVKLLIF